MKPSQKPPQIPKFQDRPSVQTFNSLKQISLHQPHLLEQSNQTQTLVPYYQEMIEEQQPRVLSSPNLQLVGHAGEIYSIKFSPNGEFLASAGFDRKILLWNIYDNCKNIGILGECKNAILEVNWSSDGLRLFTASADKTAVVWDMETYQSLKKLKGHTSYVNTVNAPRKGNEIVASGSDDGFIKLWDLRTKKFSMDIEGRFPILSLVFSEQGDKIFSGGLDNTIRCFDLRKKDTEYQITSHADTVTGICLSNDGAYLLSNSIDMTVRVFDVRQINSYVTGKNRQVRIFTGATHCTAEKNLLRCSWSQDGQYVSCGSADKFVYIWDFNSKKLVHRLGGHNGTVNETVFSPKDRILASASNDRTIIIGEIPEVSL